METFLCCGVGWRICCELWGTSDHTMAAPGTLSPARLDSKDPTPARSRTSQSKAPRGQPDPSLYGVFPELTAPGSSPGRDQRGAEPFSFPFIHRLVQSMCWSWRVNKHQSSLTKRRMLSAKFNFGKADPVAPALLSVACRGLVGAGSCQRAVPTSSPANAESRGS